jgi:hypothetical protein
VSALAAVYESRDTALEGFALNQLVHRVLVNLDTPEQDSVVEDILALRAHGVPNPVIAGMLGRLADALDLHVKEGECERTIIGLLDGLGTPAARRKLAEEVGAGRSGVKALAVRLRPALRVLGRPQDHAHDPIALVAAAGAVAAVIQTVAPATLASQSLRHELGARAHDLLLRLRDGVA